MDPILYTYKGGTFPDYLKRGNACQHIAATAAHFCKGRGVDVGANEWPLPGAMPVDAKHGGDAMHLPPEMTGLDFVFSSHCLEHLEQPRAALKHWASRLRPGGVLFLYLPHPDMTYWRPENCPKHRHIWYPHAMVKMVRGAGFVDVINSERDLAWSFSVVGFKPWSE